MQNMYIFSENSFTFFFEYLTLTFFLEMPPIRFHFIKNTSFSDCFTVCTSTQ